MKTQSLRQALDQYGFDAALGGARRDEERSRAKERVFSFRNAQHRWDPKRQRAEPWRLYNGRKRKGESIRVFPLSNWTELDVWLYIHREQIPVVPLYFAAPAQRGYRSHPGIRGTTSCRSDRGARLSGGDEHAAWSLNKAFKRMGWFAVFSCRGSRPAANRSER
jgi:3'-phosphoadenosine 5'-phosphosulfate sulfotransferase (PAPS reductase)/FAD synthetase